LRTTFATSNERASRNRRPSSSLGVVSIRVAPSERSRASMCSYSRPPSPSRRRPPSTPIQNHAAPDE
jgi:hypothetical protein